jgi:hypothetical protein
MHDHHNSTARMIIDAQTLHCDTEMTTHETLHNLYIKDRPSPAAMTSALGCFRAAIAAVIASVLLPAPLSSTQQGVATSLW